MKIVVAPDKFKGSLPATQVAAAIAAGLHAGRPGAEVVTIPVADGGEGTVDAARRRARPRWVWRARRPGTASESSRWPGAAR